MNFRKDLCSRGIFQMMDDSADQNRVELFIGKREMTAIHEKKPVCRVNFLRASNISKIWIDAPVSAFLEFTGQSAGPTAKIEDPRIRRQPFLPENPLFSAETGFENPAQCIKNHRLLRHPV